MTQATRLSRHRDGVPVYRYRTDPEIPPVSVVRYHEFAEGRPHIHDFPALWYVPEAGAVYVAAPGKVLDPRQVFPVGDGIAVFFDPVALGEDGRSPWPAWQTHPLLFPFLHGQSGGVLRLEVPAERKELWDRTIASIEIELAAREESYRQAALAHLTLLLIELARLAGDIVDDLRRSGEPPAVRTIGDEDGELVAVAARRRRRGGTDARAPDHGRSPPHRTDGARMDHRTAYGRSP